MFVQSFNRRNDRRNDRWIDRFVTLGGLVLGGLLLLPSGCGKKSTPNNTGGKPGDHNHDHNHDHDHHHPSTHPNHPNHPDHGDHGDHNHGTDGKHGNHGPGKVDKENKGQPLRFPAEAVDIDDDPNTVTIRLKPEPFRYRVGKHMVNGYAFNGQVPGPTIRIQKGQTLRVLFENGIDAPTTVHWHGIDAPFPMDGVAWRGKPIFPGETFVYEFQINQEGTFWYHPHFDTERQVDLGLYGALVVSDPAQPQADLDRVFILDTWGEWEPAEITPKKLRMASYQDDGKGNHGGNHGGHGPDHGSHGPDHGGHDHGRLGRVRWTVNGQVEPKWTIPAGKSVRARFINVSNMSYAHLRGITGEQIGSDQGLLAAAGKPDPVLMTPGDRADFSGFFGETKVQVAQYSLFGPGVDTQPDKQRDTLMMVSVEGGGASPRLDWPFTLQRPSKDPPYTDYTYTFQGDPRTEQWSINGEFFPNVTIYTIPQGSRAIIEVRNLSGSEHPFHMHGNPFEVLSVNGVPPKYKTIEDNWNLAVFDRLRFAVQANNPGDWMTHCHILPHADRGMMTVIRVE